MSDGNSSDQNYDQVVYYVAPTVLVVAIVFCCFRMALVYFMQARPNRNRPEVSPEVTPRTTMEIEAAANHFPTACREIFLRIPPPSYDETIKNDRRSRSVNDIDVEANRSNRTGRRGAHPSHRRNTRAAALRRVQSNVGGRLPISQGPPAYAPEIVDETTGIEELDSTRLSPLARETRLPSYEEIVAEIVHEQEAQSDGPQP